MSKNILLIEPGYKNKYPPLGLMKICTYHKMKGDNVAFFKGKNPQLRKKTWDRIYISTLFTFYWKKTIDTIKYYLNSVNDAKDIYVGGIMATILYDDLISESSIKGVTIIKGLLDRPGMLGNDNIVIDALVPDYDIIKPNDMQNYDYPVSNSYIAYATRGCIRNCKFCVVPRLEPCYKDYVPLKKQIEKIKEKYGEKKDLLLLDNNILASKELNKIIDEIVELGYGVNNNYYRYKKNGRKVTVRKYVDFNQGLDARLLSKEKMSKLSQIAIKPLRIAFDYADENYVNLYVEKVRMAAEYGIKNLSNYVLFNYEDTPEDLYKRLEINVKLNEEFERNEKTKGTKIFSFPMRYSPVDGKNAKDRKYIGKHWTPKYIRAIQCILIATHGVVGPKRNFFNKAFGKDINEFKKIMLMPEDYIIYRDKNEKNGNSDEWWSAFCKLKNKETVLKVIANNKFRNLNLSMYKQQEREVLKHYVIRYNK